MPASKSENEKFEPHSPRLIAVLPTFGRQALLASTLRTVMAQSRHPDAFFIVDNEASLETEQIVKDFGAEFSEIDVQYIAAPTNLGSAGGWALAFEHSIQQTHDDDWFVTLDDDDPPIFANELEEVLTLAEAIKDEVPETAAVGIVGARFDWRRGTLVRPKDSELSGAVEVDYVGSGHGAMYSAAVIRRYGGFKSELFFGYTEIEYCLRLRREGFRIFTHGALWLKHREHFNRLNLDTKPSRLCSGKWKKYYSIRNYIHVMLNFRRYDLALRQALIQVVIKPLYTLPRDYKLAKRGFRLALRAVVDAFRGNMGQTLKPDDFSGKTRH